jgi:hypothetical protein
VNNSLEIYNVRRYDPLVCVHLMRRIGDNLMKYKVGVNVTSSKQFNRNRKRGYM